MSSKYDIESFVNDIINILKSDLAAKITSINNEKNDSYTIATIPVDNFFDDIGEQVINKSLFVYYTIVDIQTNSNGPSTSLDIALAVSVIFDNKNKPGTINKVLRYSRALRETVQDKFKNTAKASSYKITEYIPVDISVNEGSEYKMGGIHINATIVG